MTALRRIAPLLCLLSLGGAAAPPDQICERLEAFETASFDDRVEPRARRWIEMHWMGSWLSQEGWGLSCRHSPDPASRKLCRWLVDGQVSYEFASRLPLRILECHGLRSPASISWRDWRADIAIWRGSRLLLLEIDFHSQMPGESGAIRFSSFAAGQDAALVEMPPLGPLPSAPPRP